MADWLESLTWSELGVEPEVGGCSMCELFLTFALSTKIGLPTWRDNAWTLPTGRLLAATLQQMSKFMARCIERVNKAGA